MQSSKLWLVGQLGLPAVSAGSARTPGGDVLASGRIGGNPYSTDTVLLGRVVCLVVCTCTCTCISW